MITYNFTGSPAPGRPGPVQILEHCASVRILDGRFAVVNGIKRRVYPGTGRELPLSELAGALCWAGDSIGCDDEHASVTVTDITGNWCMATIPDILSQSNWERLDALSRQRIDTSLKCARAMSIRQGTGSL